MFEARLPILGIHLKYITRVMNLLVWMHIIVYF
jgi:hypothetical protein